ncbi:exo-arabinanase [Haloferax sp. BAB-2207]|nr:exo-arabinanase [Haloferax sp. BAB-2207]
MQLTSVADGPNLCEISYGVQSLPLDDGT